jgi:hypothetical protein
VQESAGKKQERSRKTQENTGKYLLSDKYPLM